MKIRYLSTGRTAEVSAKAAPSEFSVFPVLSLTTTFEDGKQSTLEIQSANWGLPGYYIRHEKAGIVNGYLPGDYDEPLDLKTIPESALKLLIRSYVMITLANVFSKHGWEFQAHTYNNNHFPTELEQALNDFVNLEYQRIITKG